MRRASAILATAALALGACGATLAGCGGGGGEDDVEATLNSYVDAFVDGDGAKACSLMSAQTRTQFTNRVKLITKTSDCGKSIETIRKQAGPTVLAALKKTEVSDVKVDGDTASAKLTSGANTSRAQLRKEGGEWRVTAVPGTQ